MQSPYQYSEKQFEKICSVAMRLFSSSAVFFLAIALIIFWFCIRRWDNISDSIRDIIVAITFLSFFIIQRWFSKFSTALHLKLNELIITHESASNQLVKAEEKTEAELKSLAKEHEKLLKDSTGKL